MNGGRIRVFEGVEGDIKVSSDISQVTLNRQKPFQYTPFLGFSRRPQALGFCMPVTGKIMMHRVEHLVEHIVHGVHQVCSSSVVGCQVNMTFLPPKQPFSID